MRSKLERLIGPKGELASTLAGLTDLSGHRMPQELASDPGNVQHDYTLPMSSNRPLFIVNQHLGCCCNDGSMRQIVFCSSRHC